MTQELARRHDVTPLTDALYDLFLGDEEALWQAVRDAAKEVGLEDLLVEVERELVK